MGGGGGGVSLKYKMKRSYQSYLLVFLKNVNMSALKYLCHD